MYVASFDLCIVGLHLRTFSTQPRFEQAVEVEVEAVEVCHS